MNLKLSASLVFNVFKIESKFVSKDTLNCNRTGTQYFFYQIQILDKITMLGILFSTSRNSYIQKSILMLRV